MSFCFSVENNVVHVEYILEMHIIYNTLIEAERYNKRIWCHSIPWDLKIRLDNLIDVNNGFTWMKCFTQGCHKMTKVVN